MTHTHTKITARNGGAYLDMLHLLGSMWAFPQMFGAYVIPNFCCSVMHWLPGRVQKIEEYHVPTEM